MVLSGIYGLATFNTEEEITEISPKFDLFKNLPFKGLIVSAPGVIILILFRFLHQIGYKGRSSYRFCPLFTYSILV